MSDSFGARFVAAKAARDGVSNYALSKTTGIPDNLLGKYEKGTIPNAAYALALADALGVSLEWLIAGRGKMQPGGFDEDSAQSNYVAEFAEAFVAVGRLDGSLPPIADGTPDQEELGELLAFRREWLSSIGVLPDAARLFVIKGDGMSPTLQAGDAILVDTSDNSVEELGIYMIRADDRLMVKRIAPKIDGSLQVMSDNPIYPTEVVSASEAGGLKIVGQVRWFGRSI